MRGASLLAATSLLAAAAGCGAGHAAPPPRDEITVLGLGEVRAIPDMAVLSLGVRTRAPRAQDALAANARRISAVIGLLRARDIAETEIQTCRLAVWPEHSREGRLVGYGAENSVEVTVRDLSALASLLDEVVASGANEISGIYFGFSDPARGAEEARARALADARRKAEALSVFLRRPLGGPVRISEGGGEYPNNLLSRSSFYGEEMRKVAPGVETVRAELEVTYVLE